MTKRLALAIARDEEGFDIPGVERFAAEGLAILHAPASDDVRTPGLETLQRYAAAIEAIHCRQTILPLRFGSIVDSEADFARRIQARAEEWRAGLDAVEGCDEMGIRVLIDGTDPPRSSPSTPIPPGNGAGTSYLRSLKARFDASDAVRAESERVAGWLVEGLGSTFRDSAFEEPGHGRERLLSASFLVPRGSLDLFRESARHLSLRKPGKLLLTGPWAPYVFASASIDGRLARHS